MHLVARFRCSKDVVEWSQYIFEIAFEFLTSRECFFVWIVQRSDYEKANAKVNVLY
jgi:hypothetical protein